ncbi:MAG: hypothetical protein M5U32_19020 [Myxococcota bacterium]|nr:hypothetical protein [Myxococcota bacterium]
MRTRTPGEPRVGGDLAQCRHRLGGRQHGVEVEHRLDDQHFPGPGLERGAAQQQLIPRDHDGILLVHRDGGVRDPVEYGGPGVGIGRRRIEALEARLHERRQRCDRRLTLERDQERLDLGDLVAEHLELFRRAIQQTVAFEERAAAGPEDVAEELGPRRQPGRQRVGGPARGGRRRAVDDDQQRVGEVREEPGELVVALPYRQVLAEQADVVRVDAEMRRGPAE